MIRNRSMVLGLLFGVIVLATGLAMLLSKGWVWSLFVLLYGALGIEAERTGMWEKFISTIGLFVTGAGLHIIWSVLPVQSSGENES